MLILTLMDDFEGFRISVEEVTARCVEIARELKLELELDDVIELLQENSSLRSHLFSVKIS